MDGSPVGVYFLGKQVEDQADIEILAIDFKAGDVADPDAVRLIRFELPLQEILLFQQSLTLLVIPLGIDGDALQAHLPHQLGHIFG